MNRTSLQSYARVLRADAGMPAAFALRSALLLMLLCLLAVASEAQTTISTLSSWDGAKAAYPLGVPASVAADVYGQVFTVPSSHPVLTDFKIDVAWIWGQGVKLTGNIAVWDGGEAAANPVWSSSGMTVDSSHSGFAQLDFQIPNLTLTPGNQYVFYLTAANDSGGPAATSVGVTGVKSSSPSGGSFVYTHTYGDAANLLFPWDQPDGSSTWGDTAFQATFTGSVPPPAPASLTVSAPTVATVGSAIQFTVTAYDGYGNVLTSYTGPVHFSSTDGGATLPGNSQLTAGTGTFAATLSTTGSQTITATDASNNSLSGTSGTITVSTGSTSSGTAGPVDHLAFSNLPNFSSGSGNILSGTTFSSTVTAYDASGNVVTGYTGTLHFTSSDYAALLPADTAVMNGVGNFGFGLICYSSPCTLTATDTSTPSLTVTSAPINVTSPPTAPHLVVTVSTALTTAGTQFNGIIAAFDQYGAPMPGYTGTVHITSTDPNVSIFISNPPLPPMPWSDGPLPGGAAPFSFTLNTAGVQTITATDTSDSRISGASNAITVYAGSPATLVFSGLPATITPGTQFQATVSGHDSLGNATPGLTDVIHFTSSDPSAVLPADTALVKGSGVFTFTLNTAGSQTITATDVAVSSLTGTSDPVNVQGAGPAAIHVVSGSGQMAGIGTAFAAPLVVKVFDANGSAVSGATVQFSAPASGPSATLSAASAITGSDGTASVTATANGTLSSSSYVVRASVTGVSTPASFTLTNQQANSSLQLSASPASAVYGQPLTLTATLTPSSAGSVSPSGGIFFRDGTTELTSNAALSSGTNGLTASYTIQTPATGAHTFGAIYSGDSNFWYSETKSAVTIGKASSSLQGPATPPSLTSTAGGNIPIQVTGQFSGTGIATPSGNISYTIDSGSPATAAITAGSASIAIASGMSAGPHTLQVSYGGDSNYAAATAITVQLTVANPVDQTATTWSGPTTLTLGQTSTFTVTVTDTTTSSTIPSGSITVNDGGNPIASYSGPIALNNTGQVVLSNLNLGVGSHTLNATFSDASGKFHSSTSALIVLVNKADGTLTLSTVSPLTYGQGETVQVTVTGVVGPPSGSVSWTIVDDETKKTIAGDTSIHPVGAVASISTITVPAPLAASTYTVSATYSGDANYAASSTPVTSSFSVQKVTPTITPWPVASAISYGQTLANSTLTGGTASVAGSFAFTTPATVPGVGTALQSVTFTPTDATDYNTVSSPVSVTVNRATPTISVWPVASAISYGQTLANSTLTGGTASVAGSFAFTTPATAPGVGTASQSVTFTPTDATDYLTATGSVSVTVTKATPIIAWAPGASSILYGTTLNGILNATASFNSNPVAGTIVYAAAPSGGTASTVTTATVLSAGRYTVSATFAPTDSTDFQGTTAQTTLIVQKATTSVGLVSSANSVLVTNPVTFTTTVTSSAGTPTGSVSIYDGATLLGAVALSSGSASYTTSSLAVATHSITAVYSGDSNFTSASSSPVAEVVQDFTVGGSGSGSGGSGSSPTQTVLPGQTATFILVLGPTNGTTFPTPITMSVSGLPPGATGTLSPPIIPPNTTIPNITFSVKWPGSIASLNPKPTPSRQPLPLLWGILLLPFAAKLRRAGRRLGKVVSLLLLLAAGAATVIGLNGCGSTNGFFGQQQKTYIITITATAGNLSRSTNVTLIVE